MTKGRTTECSGLLRLTASQIKIHFCFRLREHTYHALPLAGIGVYG